MKIPFLLLALVSSSFATTTAPSKPTGLGVVGIPKSATVKAVKKSIVLHDGTNWTIVPTAAVLFLPAAMQDRVDAKPIGKLLPWSDFLAKNASWITTDEVSFEQAAGNETVPATEAANWQTQDKLVLAVHHNGPVPVVVATSLQALTQR